MQDSHPLYTGQLINVTYHGDVPNALSLLGGNVTGAGRQSLVQHAATASVRWAEIQANDPGTKP